MATRSRGSKRGAPAVAETEQKDAKRHRQGVGTSVVDFVRSPVDDFALLLLKVKAERLRPKGRGTVMSVHRLDTVAHASNILLTHNFLGVPVLNVNNKFYGFLEQKDIVKFIVNLLFRDFSETQLANIDQVFQSAETFANTVVADVMPYPVKLRSPNFIASQGSSLYTAWEILSKEDVHRLPVVDKDGAIVDIITQSMLIDFLWQNLDKIGSVADTKVSNLFGGYEGKQVISIHDTDKTYNAFRKMIAEHVSGLAVVDADNRLVDNISFRDFKRTHSEARTFWRLWDSVSEFKARSDAEHPPPMKFDKPLYVLGTDTLSTVIEQMATKHVHRIYEVSDKTSMRPVRVISQRDVLSAILTLEVEMKE